MQPHFALNALQVIMPHIENPDAEELLEELGNSMRTLFRYSSAKLIPLDVEIELVKSYVLFNSLKQNEKIDVSINLGQWKEASQVPSVPIMSIEPFVENALKHGLAKKLEISAAEIGEGFIQIIIKDNGVGLKKSEKKEIGAIDVLRERFSLLSGTIGGRWSISVKNRSDGISGVEVVILLPTIYESSVRA